MKHYNMYLVTFTVFVQESEEVEYNWDKIIEKAALEISGNPQKLRPIVKDITRYYRPSYADTHDDDDMD